jgi:hypothetical protein
LTPQHSLFAVGRIAPAGAFFARFGGARCRTAAILKLYFSLALREFLYHHSLRSTPGGPFLFFVSGLALEGSKGALEGSTGGFDGSARGVSAIADAPPARADAPSAVAKKILSPAWGLARSRFNNQFLSFRGLV